MNKILLFLAIGFATGMLSCSQQTLEKTDSLPQTYTISQERLLDKIKGGWAGQTIGVAYGGPTEFRYRSAMIQDYVPISYADGCIKNYFKHAPGLFDDIYMDLTFVEVFDRLGIDAPVDSFSTRICSRRLWTLARQSGSTLQHFKRALCLLLPDIG